MMRKSFVSPNLLLVTLVPLLAFTNVSAETTLRIGGTSAAMGGARALAEAYASISHDARPRFMDNLGTGAGLSALRAGALDVVFAARGGPEWRGQNELVSLPLSQTPLVFVANKNVHLRGITLNEAMRLYGGEQTTWPDGTRVRVVLRPLGNSDTVTLRHISRAFDKAVLRVHAVKGMPMAMMDEDSLAAIAATPGAFGTTTLAILVSDPRQQVTVLALDGVAPTEKALSDGLYKLKKTIYLVFRAPPAPEVAEFRDFALSARGRAILLPHGQIPVQPSATTTSR